MTKILLLFVCVVLLLSGCKSTVDTDNDMLACTEIFSEAGTHLMRCYDSEARMVCYVLDVYYGGGISCLPLDETALDR